MTARVKRCVCCDLPELSCGKRKQDQQRAEERAHRAEVLARPGWFESVFPGLCARCGEWFDVGTPIHLDTVKGWAALCCSEGN